MRAVEPGRLWVDPDCGLKTCGYPEAEAFLRNVVTAGRLVRVGVG
nr:hypothetical protein [Actinomadura pelletieri]